MSLLRSFATVGGLTAVSRVLGFLRDILIAAALGAGPVADAFFVAFKLPNLFRRLFGEGAFSAAFVPLFSRALEEGGKEAARDFAERAQALLLTALLVFSALAIAFMPWFMYLLAPGFSAEPEKFTLAVELSRIAFPYLTFMALVALMSGVLNALYRFAAAAAAPIVLNLFFLAALIGLAPFVGATGQLLAWTVTAAGLGQFVLLHRAMVGAGMALRLRRPRLDPEMRRLLRLMGPGVVSAGVLQVNLFVGTIIASVQAGAVSYLYYADRIYQLPLGLIGIALGVVLLPDLSRKLRGGAEAEATRSLNRGMELALLFTLPATAALLLVPGPVIQGLFERGAFGPEASRATAAALAAFALGLPAFVLVKVFSPGFFAREDTAGPMKIAAASVVANIALSLALFPFLAHVGLALATSISAWLNAALLARGLGRARLFAPDRRLALRGLRALAASLAMGAILLGLEALLSPWRAAGGIWPAVVLGILVAAGLAVFAAAALGLGACTTGELRGVFRRTPADPGPA